jgi:hypothetical protein
VSDGFIRFESEEGEMVILASEIAVVKPIDYAGEKRTLITIKSGNMFIAVEPYAEVIERVLGGGRS